MTHLIHFRTFVLGFTLSLALLTTAALASPSPAHGPDVRAGEGAKRVPFQPITAPTDGRQDHPTTLHPTPSAASPGSPPARNEELVGAKHPSFERGPPIERLGTNSPYIGKVDTYGFEINETIEFTETSWAEISIPLAEPIPMHSVSRIAVEPLNVNWEISGPSSWQPSLNVYLSDNAHAVTSVNWGDGSISPGSSSSARFGFTRRHYGFTTDPSSQATHLVFRIVATEVPGGDPGATTLFRASLSGMLHSGLFRLHVIHQDADAQAAHEFRFVDHPVSQISLVGNAFAGPYWVPIDPPVRLRGTRFTQAGGYGVRIWTNQSVSSTLLKDLLLDDNTELALDDVYVPSIGQPRPPQEHFLGHHLSRHLSLGELSLLADRSVVALRLRATQQAAPGSTAPRTEYDQSSGSFWIHFARDMLAMRMVEVGSELGTGYPSVPLRFSPQEMAWRESVVQRVSADGGYSTIAKIEVPGPGTVTFSLRNPEENQPCEQARFGSLYYPWDPDFVRACEIAVEAIEVEPGRYMAFCGYQSPASFDDLSGSTSDEIERGLRIVGAFEPDGFNAPTAFGELDFALTRAPVLFIPDFVRGFWHLQDWPINMGGDPRFRTTVHGYHANIAAAEWSGSVASAVRQTISDYRRPQSDDPRRGAAAAVDVVGFGLGGLMARSYIDEKGPEIWNSNIARLMTVGTPHLGSPVAEQLAIISDHFTSLPAQGPVTQHFTDPAVRLGDTVPMREIADGVTAQLGSSSVPSHAIVGSGGKPVIARALSDGVAPVELGLGIAGGLKGMVQWVVGEVFEFITGLGDVEQIQQHYDELFGIDKQHDLFVSTTSAAGKLPTQAVTVVPWVDSPDGLGIQNTLVIDPRVQDRVTEVLLAPPSAAEWAIGGFPAVNHGDLEKLSTLAMAELIAALAAIRGFDAVQPSLTLESSSGAIVPGSPFELTITPPNTGSPAVAVASATVVGNSFSLNVHTPLQPSVKVAPDEFGVVPVASIVFMSDGTALTGWMPPFNSPLPELVSLEASSDLIEFTRYDRERPIGVLGTLSTGDLVDPVGPPWNIRFRSMDPDIADVTADGLVSAGLKEGHTTIRIWSQPSNMTSVSVYNSITSLCDADLTGSSVPNDPHYGVPNDIVDADDFFFFLQMFASGDPRADLTGSSTPGSPSFGLPDGLIDADDFFYFLYRFAEGCP